MDTKEKANNPHLLSSTKMGKRLREGVRNNKRLGEETSPIRQYTTRIPPRRFNAAAWTRLTPITKMVSNRGLKSFQTTSGRGAGLVITQTKLNLFFPFEVISGKMIFLCQRMLVIIPANGSEED